jgi:hypothetical protein
MGRILLGLFGRRKTMSSLDPINDLLRRYGVGGGPANREEARVHYDQIAQAVPQDILASVIGPAIGSLPAVGSQPGGLSSLLEQVGVSPQVAQDPQQASPEEIGKVAAYAKKERPDVFH